MDKNVFGGLITGVALGLLIALLTAPEEGYLFRNRFLKLLSEKMPSIPFLDHEIPETTEEELH